MKNFNVFFKALFQDEDGLSSADYAIGAGFITIAAIAGFMAIKDSSSTSVASISSLISDSTSIDGSSFSDNYDDVPSDSDNEMVPTDANDQTQAEDVIYEMIDEIATDSGNDTELTIDGNSANSPNDISQNDPVDQSQIGSISDDMLDVELNEQATGLLLELTRERIEANNESLYAYNEGTSELTSNDARKLMLANKRLLDFYDELLRAESAKERDHPEINLTMINN